MSRLRVLLYHEIVPRSEWPAEGPGPVRTAQGIAEVLPLALYVWEDQFEAQLRWLESSAWTVVNPESAAAYFCGEADLPERSVLICVDDLWKQGSLAAAAALRRRGWRALAFMVSAWVFNAPQVARTGSPVCLSWPELAALGDVFAFGNHGDRLHVRGGVSVGAKGAAPGELAADLARCEARTTLPKVYAYPFGAADEAAMRVLAAEGYRLAFTTEPGENGEGSRPLALRRDIVPRELGMEGFAAMFR